jgi:hypothetical protein|uniref:Uncharacterized protein n=1 Tax=viral metagenome TaxID=1070528 RepID=A0A6C0CHN5_9ZZZZ
MEDIVHIKEQIKYLINEVEKYKKNHKRLLDNIKKYKK